MADEKLVTCSLCSNSKANYTCPRCNVRYCSVNCYRSQQHLECSEIFYQNCVMQSLGSSSADNDQRQRMVDMLKNFEKEQCENDDEAPDLAERLSGIDLDGDPEKILGALTPAEVKQFEAMVESEDFDTDLVELWKPWWCEPRPCLLEDVSETPSKQIPSLLEDVGDLGKLLQSKAPSDTIGFDIINCLYGYAYVGRLYNGDQLSLSLECCTSLLNISMSLNQKQFFDVPTAIGSCISCIANSSKQQSLFVSQEYSVAIVEDVVRLLKGPNSLSPLLYIMAALSDCRRLFRKSCKMLKNENKNNSKQQMFYRVQRKLEFYFSWVKGCGILLQELVPMVELEFCSMSSNLFRMKGEIAQAKSLLDEQKTRKDRVLIEEL